MAHTYQLKATHVSGNAYKITCPYCLKTHMHVLSTKELKSLMGVLPYVKDNYVYRSVFGCGTYEITEIDE